MRVDRPLTRSLTLALLLVAAGPACRGHGSGGGVSGSAGPTGSTAGGAGPGSTANPVTSGSPATTGATRPTVAGATTTPTAAGPHVASVADSLVQGAARVSAARARGVKDLSAVSDAFVHVRADGSIEVVLHAPAPATANQLAEVGRLGGEVVSSSTTPAGAGGAPTGLVQAWVPADKLDAAARLAWVGAITPPSYAIPGG